ncbi:NADH dehydrogenase [ubiquinone] 1 alpha subcomplex subunit 6-like [Danaus plexippus]|uniref:NADH dehydrogenase [ubiquinone] 1 alpha subcomplex subunit 6 n=1 Tax=Danaus plexippus plexippus TaxID=278856 RepID=A0A212EJF9_DANPL|nr:NADH dehydrogenase [ubiquinone] 1 alpha subcomplex subunit 6-like [Danaus plexippus]OWR41600.1 NADH dehydrogenase [Danaus plexippus plexippus]
MSARQAIQVGTKTVKPVLSVTQGEARLRVLNLYKAWYRQIPYIVKDFDIPKSEEQCRAKLKEIFLRNKDVTDIRVIDILVIKGQMELKESVNIWKQKGHIMAYFKPTEEPKPKDFLSKFFSGVE